MRRISALIVGLLIASSVPLVTAPVAKAGQLDVLGVTVTWQDTMYRPTSGCSVFYFDYANNVGFRLLSIDFDILDPFNQRLGWESAIGVPNGTRGTWDIQLCSFEFDNGNGPYTFRLSIEDYDNNTRSAETTFMFSERPRTPGSPSGVTGIPGNGQVTVNWSPPFDRGGTLPLTYTATASPGGQTCTVVNATSCTVTGLTNGTAYTFGVTASNIAGTSSPSLRSSFVTPVGPPQAPLSVSARASNSSALVSWQAPANNGGSPVTQYTVTASPGGATCVTAVTNCAVLGLTNGTAYTFSVVARNAAGDSAPSASSSPITPFGVPSEPLDVSASTLPGQVTITWTPPISNGGAPITGYTASVIPTGRTCTTTAFTCTISGLTNGTSYTVQVRANNAAGASLPGTAAERAIPVGPPGQVRGLAARPGKESALVSWRAPATNGGSPITAYEYRVGQGPWMAVSGLRVSLSKLVSGRLITISVRAVNDVGPGNPTTLRVTPR